MLKIANLLKSKKSISVGKILAGAVLALLVVMAVKARMDKIKLDERLAETGFSSEYEMDSATERGFASKQELDDFIASPMSPSEAESVLRCVAVSEFWESKDLGSKTNVPELYPWKISTYLDGYGGLLDDYFDEYYDRTKQDRWVKERRLDFQEARVEDLFRTEGADKLKDEYLRCHQEYKAYVLTKCEEKNDCRKPVAVATNEDDAEDSVSAEPEGDSEEAEKGTGSTNSTGIINLSSRALFAPNSQQLKETNCKIVNAITVGYKDAVAASLRVPANSLRYVGTVYSSWCMAGFETPKGFRYCQCLEILSDDNGQTGYCHGIEIAPPLCGVEP